MLAAEVLSPSAVNTDTDESLWIDCWLREGHCADKSQVVMGRQEMAQGKPPSLKRGKESIASSVIPSLSLGCKGVSSMRHEEYTGMDLASEKYL